MNYEPKTFTFPELEGISKKTMDEHVGLYQGYVKNFNAISAAIAEMTKDHEKNTHAISELIRRRSFEFDGMRLHEHYFAQFVDGAKELDQSGTFAAALTKEYRSLETFTTKVMTTIASMRGPGWAILYFDPETKPASHGLLGRAAPGPFRDPSHTSCARRLGTRLHSRLRCPGQGQVHRRFLQEPELVGR